MIYNHEYTTQEERENIINSNTDKYLIEERNIKEGNFLIFTDVKPIEIEVQETKERLTSTENTLIELLMEV